MNESRQTRSPENGKVSPKRMKFSLNPYQLANSCKIFSLEIFFLDLFFNQFCFERWKFICKVLCSLIRSFHKHSIMKFVDDEKSWQEFLRRHNQHVLGLLHILYFSSPYYCWFHEPLLGKDTTKNVWFQHVRLVMNLKCKKIDARYWSSWINQTVNLLKS